MKINTNDILVNLQGEALKDGNKELTLGLAIANVLVSGAKSTEPLRAYVLSKKLFDTKGELDLDSADVSFLKKTIEDFEGYITLVKGQILEKFV